MEKNHEVAVENVPVQPAAEDLFDKAELQKVIRKLDFRLVPLCFLLNMFSLLDRSNLGNAKVAGLTKDIDLSGNRYQWLGTIFYIAYIVFEFMPIGWKLFKPHKWVTCAVVFWGTISTMQALASSWGGLMALRFLLGVAETMFGNGMPLYFSYFYPREYIGTRLGIFVSAGALANAYGGALAYGISHIHTSISTWKLLFILEGIPTVLLAPVCWFCLPDSPANARFLSERERRVAQAFARSQPGDYKNPGLQLNQLFAALKDYRNWMLGLIFFCCNVSFASMPLFLPTIISELGTFSSFRSNGLSAPLYLLAFLMIIATTWTSDYFAVRGPFIVMFGLIGSAGYLILALSSDVASRYAGLFLVVLMFVTITMALVWNANSNETDSKRAGGIWVLMTIGQSGTVLGTNMFPASEKPYYRKGMWIGFSCSMIAAVAGALLSFLIWRENRRRDKIYGKVDSVRARVGMEDNGPPEATIRYLI